MTRLPLGGAPGADGVPNAPVHTRDASVRGADSAAVALVAQLRQRLRRVVYVRAAIIGVATACALAVVLLLAARQWPGSSALSRPVVLLIPIAAGIALALVQSRRAGLVTPLRTALWIEEQTPAGFSLVTLVENTESAEHDFATGDARRLDPRARERLAVAFLDAVGGSARVEAQVDVAARALSRDRLRDPAAFGAIAMALLTWLILVPLTPAGIAGDSTRSGMPPDHTGTSAAVAPIGAWTVRVEPPAYSRLPMQQLGNADEVHALAGSRVIVLGAGAPVAGSVRVLGDASSAVLSAGGGAAAVDLGLSPPTSRAVVSVTADGWRAPLTVAPLPTELRLSRGGATRLLLVDGYRDSIPRVALRLPERDSVLRSATGRLALQATIHDDLGLASGSFELIVSSGEGERFTARTVRIATTRYTGARDVMLRGVLDLDSMQLGPGDIVHLRAVARDANPARDRESGVSETRSLRVARPAEYDSVAVEPAPPPEVDKSLLSQRMLLMLTEKLEQRRPRLARDVLQSESRNLARDQARLRLAVGDAVFQRLSGESSAEHAHTVGDGHDHGVESVGGKLAMPGGVSATGMLEEGDDSPVIGINTPLLEAYNAMWDAGRALELSDTKGAIPHMRVALAAIERARAASRLYLRGMPPVVILDLDKIRLAGKDTGATNVRSMRAAVLPRSKVREARLLAAASMARTDAPAARDSVAVLRVESLGDAPGFASALVEVIERLRAGGDATEAFVRARRVLGGMSRANDAAWSRVGPP